MLLPIANKNDKNIPKSILNSDDNKSTANKKSSKKDFISMFEELGKTQKTKKEPVTNTNNKEMQKIELKDSMPINNIGNKNISKTPINTFNPKKDSFINEKPEEKNLLTSLLNNKKIDNKILENHKKEKPLISQVAQTITNNNSSNLQNKIDNIENGEKNIKPQELSNISKQENNKNTESTKPSIINNMSDKDKELNKQNNIAKKMENDINANSNNQIPTISTIIDNKQDDIKNDLNKNTNKEENKPSLGIKNTLKYGAFAAFDALSLLKPSNGKKLSELIKKADELAINLEKIKYEKSKTSIPKSPINIDTDIKDAKTKDTISKQSPKENLAQDEELKDIIKESKTNEKIKENTNEKNDVKQKANNDNKVDSKETLNQDSKTDINTNNINTNKLAQKMENLESKIDNKETQEKNLEGKDEVKKTISLKQDGKQISEKKVDKKKDNPIENITNTNIKNEQTQKIFDSKEVIKNFVNQLQQEIINYKPPLSRLTIELNPANLGNVEVTITHQGKNIQIQMNANQSVLNLFIQNSTDLRNALSQIGYDNVAMNFSNGSSMGFSNKEGKWEFQELDNNIQDGNENSLDEKIANLEINIINNYA